MARRHPTKLFFPLLVLTLLMLAAPLRAEDYIIGEGDTLQIAVWGVDRLNLSVKVRPDGKITVPGLGDLPGAGMAPEELQVVLTEKLKDLVKNPIVTVTVSEITNSKVHIFGSGVKSTVYELNRKTTLLQILCSLTDTRSADLRGAYLLRNGQKVKQDFSALYLGGDVAEDIQVLPNDAIFIPLLLDKNVYVLGAVTTPKFIEFREGMTVMEAIIEGGGFTKFAAESDVLVVRKEKGNETGIRVRVGDLLKKADLSQNIRLKPGDYIIVKESFF